MIHYQLSRIKYHSKIIWEFIKDVPFRSWDKILETIEWLTEAFTNWDMQLYDFKDQLIDIFYKTAQFIHIIVDKIKYIVGELQELLRMFLSGLKGWQ